MQQVRAAKFFLFRTVRLLAGWGSVATDSRQDALLTYPRRRVSFFEFAGGGCEANEVEMMEALAAAIERLPRSLRLRA